MVSCYLAVPVQVYYKGVSYKNRSVYSDVYLLRQQLPNWLALFSNLIGIQKRKQNHNYWQRIQKLKTLVGKTMP